MTTLRGSERAERITALKGEGKSVKEIAKELGVSAPTVYNTLKGKVRRKATKPRPVSGDLKAVRHIFPVGMVSILQTDNDQTLVQIRVKNDQVPGIVNKIFA
jgi:transposase